MATRRNLSDTTDTIPSGVLALVRLLARAAAKEAFADQANKRGAPDETAAPTTAMEHGK